MYPLENILFLDIETVAATANYEQLSPALQVLWKKKTEKLTKDPTVNVSDFFFERAAIYAEFGKVITIALGMLKQQVDKRYTLYTKIFSGHDEKKLLTQFKSLVEKNKKLLYLCAHNGKEFDFPYLCRRMLVHDITLPSIFNLQGKKPWEIKHIDTMDMWKFGDRKNFTSLDLLAAIFNIPSSKYAMDGSQVNAFYYQKNRLEDIQQYCLADVEVLVKVYLKIQGIQEEITTTTID